MGYETVIEERGWYIKQWNVGEYIGEGGGQGVTTKEWKEQYSWRISGGTH